MAEVARALSRLSRTMERRGGIGGALLRGADFDIQSRRIGAADDRAQSIFESGQPGRDLAASRAGAEMELGPIPRQEHMPTNSATGMVQHFAKDKSGLSNQDIFERAIPGSQWVQGEGGIEFRADKEGNVLQLPKWRRDEIRERSMFTTMLRTDPKHFLGDQILELQMQQEGAENPAQLQQQIDKLKGVMDDPDQMATLYGNQISKNVQALTQLIAQGADPRFIKFAQSEITRTRAKYDALTKKPSLKDTKALKLLDRQIAVADAKLADIKKGGPEGEKPRTRQQKFAGRAKVLELWNKSIENISHPYNLEEDPAKKATIKEQGIAEISGFLEPDQAVDIEPVTGGPPVPGAQQAQDGNWYVERGGQFFPVVQRGEEAGPLAGGRSVEDLELADVKGGEEGAVVVYDHQENKIGSVDAVEVLGTTRNGFEFGLAPVHGTLIKVGDKWRTPSKTEFELIQEASQKKNEKISGNVIPEQSIDFGGLGDKRKLAEAEGGRASLPQAIEPRTKQIDGQLLDRPSLDLPGGGEALRANGLRASLPKSEGGRKRGIGGDLLERPSLGLPDTGTPISAQGLRSIVRDLATEGGKKIGGELLTIEDASGEQVRISPDKSIASLRGDGQTVTEIQPGVYVMEDGQGNLFARSDNTDWVRLEAGSFNHRLLARLKRQQQIEAEMREPLGIGG